MSGGVEIAILCGIVAVLALSLVGYIRLDLRKTTKLLEMHKQRQQVLRVLDTADSTVPVADVREALNVKLS